MAVQLEASYVMKPSVCLLNHIDLAMYVKA